MIPIILCILFLVAILAVIFYKMMRMNDASKDTPEESAIPTKDEGEESAADAVAGTIGRAVFLGGCAFVLIMVFVSHVVPIFTTFQTSVGGSVFLAACIAALVAFFYLVWAFKKKKKQG